MQFKEGLLRTLWKYIEVKDVKLSCKFGSFDDFSKYFYINIGNWKEYDSIQTRTTPKFKSEVISDMEKIELDMCNRILLQKLTPQDLLDTIIRESKKNSYNEDYFTIAQIQAIKKKINKGGCTLGFILHTLNNIEWYNKEYVVDKK